MNTLYIIAPAYNEEENIHRFVNDWYPVVENHNEEGCSRLVVVNDGSKDRTAEILSSLSDKYPLLIPLTKENGGHGDSVLFGYQYALSNNPDFIFQTDSDGQTDPSEFDAFWELRNDYEAVFGKRIKRGDGASRAFVETVLCKIIKWNFHVAIPDANAPFRLMKKSYLGKYLPMIPEHFNLPNVLLTTLGAYYHERIRFMEISFFPRQGGKNSINIPRIFKIGMKAVIDFREIKKAWGQTSAN